MTHYLLTPLIALALAAIPAALSAHPAASEGQTADAAADPYQALASTLTSDIVIRTSFETALRKGLGDVLRAEAETVELDQKCPGLINAMVEAARPVVWPEHLSGYMKHRADLDALFRRELSPADAGGIAAFYNSELGLRATTATLDNTDLTQILETITDDDNAMITANSAAADKRRTIAATTRALDVADVAAIDRIVAENGWGEELRRIMPQIEALQLKMLNTLPSEEEQSAFENALDWSFDERLNACEAAE